MGHVPPGPVRLLGPRRHLQGRQRGGASGEGAVAITAAIPDRRRTLGAAGEDLAAEWYRQAGYEILGRNWRCSDGELDLVARRDGVLVFCEVKTRSSDRFGRPAEAVGPAKQRRLRRLAIRWLADVSRDRGPAAIIRFDVVSILGGELEVVEAAF